MQSCILLPNFGDMQNMKSVKVLSKRQFDITEPNPEAIAIRIIDPEQEIHSDILGYKDEIKLAFWDLAEPFGKYGVITEQQAGELYQFMKKHKDVEHLVVHCMAGISRSNTVAIFFAAHIAKDDYIASQLTNDRTKIINYAVWDALKKQAIADNNWNYPFT